DHIRRERVGGDRRQQARERGTAKEAVGGIRVADARAEANADRPAGDRRDDATDERRGTPFAVAEDDVGVVPPLPEARERLRTHLVVAVGLEDPLTACLRVAAQDRPPMTPTRLADRGAGGALGPQRRAQPARAGARAVAVAG